MNIEVKKGKECEMKLGAKKKELKDGEGQAGNKINSFKDTLGKEGKKYCREYSSSVE